MTPLMRILSGRRTAAILEQAFQVIGGLVAIAWLALIAWLLSVGAAEIGGVLIGITLFVALVFARNELGD